MDKKFLDEALSDLTRAYGHELPGAAELGEELLKVIRNKEDLTYVAAYAGLQHAYDQLRAESSFVQTQPDHSLVDLVKQSLAEDGLGK